MDATGDTNAIRALAPKWSLAGDDKLLSLLEKTHQRILSKCQDVNSKLEEMASVLDAASINLQNVNNKFMALSNSQFIESRVYDDDEELTADTQPLKELSPPPRMEELSVLKNSLAILERAHETAEILDDSDSDSDTEISVVLKPRDLYARRPLPHIIGSQPWKNKWHAGLIVEDSDSDSTTSKHDERELDQYSDSGSEPPRPSERLDEQTISESSSSLDSCHPLESPGGQRPADIAAELARRLGGPAQMAAQEPEAYLPPAPTTRKVYKPELPATSNIFPDEPPPLDPPGRDSPGRDSPGRDSPGRDSPSEDDDIFAEINKRTPYTQPNTAQSQLTDDLFSFAAPAPARGAGPADIVSDFGAAHVKPQHTQKSMLFEDESEPELFAEPPPKKEVIHNNNNIEKLEETSTKKPVGGISLFGSNKGAESIGAAILKRNQRKSSTSGDESESDNIRTPIIEKPKNVPRNIEKPAFVARSKNSDETDNKSLPKKEKDIFDDLFAKSQKVTEKKPAQKMVKEVTVKEKEKKNVKDLFSDNIFDDIDDIFTSNVKIPPKGSNQKSIFDDDDDDLFSEIAKPKVAVNQATTVKDNKKTSIKENKSIFDSDEDLFGDVETTGNIKRTTKNVESQKIEPIKVDQTDNLKAYTNVLNEQNHKRESAIKVENIVKPTENTKQKNLFNDSPQKTLQPEIKTQTKSKGIFDSDSDEDIFAKVKISDAKKSNKPEKAYNSHVDDVKTLDIKDDLFKSESNTKLPTEHLKVKEKSVMKSPSLFGEDEIDELFTNTNKRDQMPVEPIDLNVEQTVIITSELEDNNKDIFLGSEGDDNKLDNNIAENIKKIQTEQHITKELVGANKKSIKADSFEVDLPEDDLFPTPKETKLEDILSKNIVEDKMVPEVIESSQEISKLTTEEPRIKSIVEQTKTDIHFEETKSSEAIKTDTVIETLKTKPRNKNQSIFDDLIEPFKEKEKEPVTAFDDIFTEPPAFEKPSEPKKSKNVNALFDDDSDDESLFFKKNDVISDEKPDIFTNNANFGLFVDEPPAIGVDFTTKSSKTIDLDDDDDLFASQTKIEEIKPKAAKNTGSNNDEDMISSVTAVQQTLLHSTNAEAEPKIAYENKETKSQNDGLFTEDLVEDLFTTPRLENPMNIETEVEETSKLYSKDIDESDEGIFNNLSKPIISKSSDGDISEQTKTMEPKESEKVETANNFDDIFASKESPKKEEIKKIGKLNTKNFNINVSALMPGASPKKKPKEPRDEQNLSNETDEPKKVKLFPNTDETDKSQPKSPTYEESVTFKEESEPKSLTFEEKPESEVLDNKVSKQRPRIQVKRRPSSRRARHEAVRRSGIDFGDETDNSSSIDEPVKIRNENKKTNTEPEKSRHNTKEDSFIESKHIKADTEDQTQDTNEDKLNEPQEENARETVYKTNEIENVDTNVLASDSSYSKNDQKEVATKTETTKQDVPKNDQKVTKTKVVYILNDEDIFNTGPKCDPKLNEDIFGTKHTEPTPDDIFGNKSMVTTPDDDIFKSVEGVKTLGNAYKEHTKELSAAIKSDFDTIKPAAELIKKDENTIVKDEKPSQNVKSSIFSDSDEELFHNNKKVTKTSIFDSDSEEDLFSGKKRKEKNNQKQKDREVKERKVVKGSLFGDEDDDDLFGVKKEKFEPKQEPSKPSTSRESVTTASKSAEPVFDDPLSMLGDDD